MRQRLSDWWWIGKRQTRYVCPLLMTLSLYVWRLRGKSAHWYQSGDSHRVLLDGERSLWEMPCVFPKRWIRAECDFRNWMLRWRYRLRLCR